LTSPDTDGRLLSMIQTVAGYARERDKMDGQRIDAILETVKAASLLIPSLFGVARDNPLAF
jgi:hypothetical protein